MNHEIILNSTRIGTTNQYRGCENTIVLIDDRPVNPTVNFFMDINGVTDQPLTADWADIDMMVNAVKSVGIIRDVETCEERIEVVYENGLVGTVKLGDKLRIMVAPYMKGESSYNGSTKTPL
jgi:hypothetical protein